MHMKIGIVGYGNLRKRCRMCSITNSQGYGAYSVFLRVESHQSVKTYEPMHQSIPWIAVYEIKG